uniref:Uncharacterized protein n=1 Tax=Tetranychus urticae TaxID=32264 RepID=T1KT91_TETUR
MVNIYCVQKVGPKNKLEPIRVE